MKTITLYFNDEMLPTYKEPQVMVLLSLPSFSKWFVSAPTYIGFNIQKDCQEFAFVILGFGLIYHKNWDI